MRRTKPAAVHARSTSYTAWVDTEPNISRADTAIVSTVECGRVRNVVNTATRGSVTRKPTERSNTRGSKSFANSSITTHTAPFA